MLVSSRYRYVSKVNHARVINSLWVFFFFLFFFFFRVYNTFKLQKVLTVDERQKAHENLDAGEADALLMGLDAVQADDKVVVGPVVKLTTRLNSSSHTKKWTISTTGQFAKVCVCLCVYICSCVFCVYIYVCMCLCVWSETVLSSGSLSFKSGRATEISCAWKFRCLAQKARARIRHMLTLRFDAFEVLQWVQNTSRAGIFT